MADRYWRGGSGTWSAAATTNWSATSGGAGGASAPTSADDVYFDVNSNVGTGAFTVTVSAATCRSCTISGLDGAMTLALGTSTLTVRGSWVNPATSFTITGTTGNITFNSGVAVSTIETNGYTFPRPVLFASSSNGYSLSSAFTINNTCTLTSGTLDINDFALTCNVFSSSNTNTRAIDFGTADIFLASSVAATTVLNMSTTTGLTITGTGGFSRNQVATATVTSNVTGGAQARSPNLFITGGSAALTIASSSKFINLNFTGSSCAVTSAGTVTVYEDLTLSATGSYTVSNFTFGGTGAQTITSNGATIVGDVSISGAVPATSSTVLGDALSCITLQTNTSFNASGFNVTATDVDNSTTVVRTVIMGSGTWTLTGAGAAVWNASVTTGLTFDAGTSTISLTSASAKTFVGGNLGYYNLNQGGTGALTITGTNSFNDITASAYPSAITFTAGTTQTVSNFNVDGIDGALVTLQSSVVGTRFTLSKSSGTVAVQHLAIRDSEATGGATWNATDSADVGNNTGWNITLGPPKYWVGGTASWDGTAGTKWSLSSGGAGGAVIPTLANPVVFDAASGSVTCTYSLATSIVSLDCTGFTGTLTGTVNMTLNGSLILGSGMTYSRTGTTTLIGTGTLTSAGKSISTLVIDGVGITVTLGDAFNSAASASITLTNGTLDLNNFSLSTGTFLSNNSNVRSIAFGTTGNILVRTTAGAQVVLNMATATNFTFTGNSSVSANMTTGRIFSFGETAGATDSNHLNINILSGSSNAVFRGFFRNVNFTGYTGALSTGTITCQGFTLASGGSYGNTDFFMVGSGSIDFVGRPIEKLIISGGGVTTLASAGNPLEQVTIENGTLDLAGFTLTTVNARTLVGTKNLTFNGGTLVLTGTTTNAWSNAQPAGFTTTAGTGTGTISLTAATAKTFTGGGSVYNCTLNQGGAGSLTITGSNTFDDITNTVQPASVLFTASTTNTFLSDFSLSGVSGSLVTIGSATAANHTLVKAGGTVSVSFCTISRSVATGGASWQAFTANGNVNGGNNSGWIFAFTASSNFLMLFT